MAAKFSKEEQYAVLALIHLAEANGKKVQVREIAKHQKIPERFLELILAKLRTSGMVCGKRGPGGGYWLAKTAAEICLKDVVRALKPEPSTREKVEESGYHKVLEDMWTEVSSSFDGVLNTVSIQELCLRAQEIAQSDAAIAERVADIAEQFVGAPIATGSVTSAPLS